MPSWTIEAGTTAGVRATDLLAATDRRFSFRLSAPSTVDFALAGDDPGLAHIVELASDLWISRDSTLLLRARVGPTADALDADRHKVTVSAVDYRGVLAGRLVWPGSTTSFTAVDQASIAWQLIADTQALTGGGLGITNASSATGRTRDRDYEVGKRLSEAIDQLGAVIDGFDWDIDPDLAFQLYYPQRGTARDLAIVWGDTASQVDRKVDTSDYATALRCSGADSLTPVTRVAAGIATAPEGRWETQIGDSDIAKAVTLGDKADAALLERSVILPAYTATLRAGVWSPSTLWLGDTCRVVVRSGRLDVDTTARVVQIDVSVDDNGAETVKVTFDRTPADLSRVLAGMRGRLTDLERR